MKTKIIIVISHLGSGGAQRQVLEYLKFADKASYDIKVVNLDLSYDMLSDKIGELGFEITGLHHKGFFSFKTLFRLISIFRKEKPDIVHTYLFTADMYGRLAAKVTGVKIVINSIRNMDKWAERHHVFVENILAKFTNKITINADKVRAFLHENRKIDDNKIVRIYNGVELSRFDKLKNPVDIKKALSIPDSALVVGMVSRLSEQKDYETFFKAAERVVDKVKDVYFVAVGEGPKRQELEKAVRSRKYGEKVIFTGLRRDVPDLINAMDICVLSSHYEGCPNVILEYMAVSKPVVASDVGGCSELVIDGESGFIVPPENSHALGEKIVALVNDNDLRKKMGLAGRKRVEEKFTSKKMAENTEKLYRELLDKKSASLRVNELNELKRHQDSKSQDCKNTKDKGLERQGIDNNTKMEYTP